jgi:UDP-N-acetylmuramyl pentapeptide phosphotransferase/UDP-N-acetylglucosamine-1-phosphate transferase
VRVTQAWLFPLSALSSCGLTFLVWYIIDARHIRDIPNERSMHSRPLAIGAGWAFVGCVLAFWPWSSDLPRSQTILVCAAMLVLAIVSWKDDLSPLPPLLRLVLQAAVVAACLASLPSSTLVLGGHLPPWLDRCMAGLAWLWFINLYNFMDGIDGITGTETAGVCLGFVLLAGFGAGTATNSSLGLILAGASLGFLVWNWHPSRIILGDVGSVPLGFLVGWLMLDLALRGHLAAAVILPMYHIADATHTLVRRILTVPEPWRPHRQHAYQRAVLGRLRPPQVVIRIAVLNAVLAALALLSLTRAWLAFAAAALATLGLLIHFTRSGQSQQDASPSAETEP